MATGKSSFARNYDKILAALSVVLLAGAIFLFITTKSGVAAEKAAFDSDLASRTPAHPALDMEAATARNKASHEALQRMVSPFKMAVDTEAKDGFFVPKTRVWCVKCRKPIPFESEECPLCGEPQPKRVDGAVADAMLDSDGDGMPDVWEREHGFNPLVPEDAALDEDGDGFTNLEEFQANTDPKDKGSHPDLMDYLRVASAEASRLPVLFKSTSNMGGGNYKCQFDYTDRELGGKVKTVFVKVGEPIGPLDRLPGSPIGSPPRYSDYKLVSLDWREEKVFDKITNREKTEKVPFVVVERISSGRKTELSAGRETTGAAFIITFVQTRDGTEYVADGGEGEAEFAIGDDKFTFVSLDRSSRVVNIRRQSDKKVFSVPRLE